MSSAIGIVAVGSTSLIFISILSNFRCITPLHQYAMNIIEGYIRSLLATSLSFGNILKPSVKWGMMM